MEIRIGVRDVARELVIESDESHEEIAQRVATGLGSGQLLTFTDDKGRQILVPAAALGYLDMGAQEKARVGFGH